MTGAGRSGARPGDRPEVRLTGRAAEVRRRVGPAGWVLLEALVAVSSTDDVGGAVAATHVRALAGELGLSKYTVAGALSRLIGAGLVERRTVRRSSRFAGSVYALVEDVGLVLSCPGCPCPNVPDTITSDRKLLSSSSRTGHTVIGDEEPAAFEPMRLFE